MRPITRKGKFLVGLIRMLFKIRVFFGGTDWQTVWSTHHEDPLYMRAKELLYFAHKYYFRIIQKSGEAYQAETYFHSLTPEFNSSAGLSHTQQITISAAGDLMPYYCINKQTCESLWDECGDFFFDADIVTANLETPLDIKKPVSFVPEVMLSNMYFNANNEMFEVFSGNGRYKGFDVLSIANNHSLDQGEEGLISTMRFLEERKIAYCGASPTPSKSNDFPIIEKNGIKIAFLAATFSLNAETLPQGKAYLVNHIQLNQPKPDISILINQAKLARERGADFIVAHLHMGCAYQPYPSQHTIENIHSICRNTGIDIVLGGHPHNAQPMELLSVTDPFSGLKKKSFIIYSMGDFIAYDIFKWCHLPVMLKFTITKNQQQTEISGLQLKLAYMEATTKNANVEMLKLRDYASLSVPQNGLNADSEKEFKELQQFANQYLLPGNYENFLI